MPIDFPNSPTVGQRFTSNSFTFEWNGTVWNRLDETTSFINSDTPPPSPTVGQLWYDTTNLELFVWHDDGDSQQWIAVAGGTGIISPDYTKNRVINGNFQIWQRATSGTADGYIACDRWRNDRNSGTVTQSRQDFTVGDKLGANTPRFYLRHAVTGQSAVSDYGATSHRIESVRTYDDKTITVLGWARRSSGAGDMAVEAYRNYGTGGSPSAAETVGTPQQVALTADWAPFAVTMTIPSITGKTLGTNNDDYLQLGFWFSGGSNFNARNASLGIQTITVDLWGIHVLPGTYGADITAQYLENPVGEEFNKCMRYYYRFDGSNAGGLGLKYASTTAATWGNNYGTHPVVMRATPTLTAGFSNFDNCNLTGVSHSLSNVAFTIRVNTSAIGTYRAFGGTIEFGAEL